MICLKTHNILFSQIYSVLDLVMKRPLEGIGHYLRGGEGGYKMEKSRV